MENEKNFQVSINATDLTLAKLRGMNLKRILNSKSSTVEEEVPLGCLLVKVTSSPSPGFFLPGEDVNVVALLPRENFRLEEPKGGTLSGEYVTPRVSAMADVSLK